ncbi:RING-H2 finger protein ATL80-like [Ipomoea triloba]|uniref:RING-H2 finger protein ATL80-like n=1 Tax=Ipomoea triloba TaxID=35885 RepID=UPI00125E430C|nr:RING-H2 finger protein ATL80-like [Ipomoea triloba]
MTDHSTIHGGVKSSNQPSSTPPPNDSSLIGGFDSDFVVILAALLCALICVLGLAAVARCAWIRRISAGAADPPPPPANKGLKKKILKSFPKLSFAPELASKFSECAICLTEFASGDEIRVLPHCGHGFHVGCIDTWLGSHSSCPSCRQILVSSRCHKCGEFPAPTSSSTAAAAAPVADTRFAPSAYHVNPFLP